MRFLFLLIPYILLAQNALAQCAVVGLPNMRMLYIGIENPIEVAIEGVKSKDLIVKLKNVEVKGEKGRYTVLPEGEPRIEILKIGKKKANKIIWIDSIEYKIQKLPEPVFALGIRTKTPITAKNAASANLINGFAEETFPIQFKVRVFGYTFVLLSDSNKTYYENVDGNRITESIKQRLNSAKTGDQIIIAQIDYTINGRRYISKGRDFYINNTHEDVEEEEKIKIFLPEETILYPNKKVKLHFKNNLSDSIGNVNYYYETGELFIRGNYLVRDNFYLAVDDSAFREEDYFSIYWEIDQCLYGYQEVFYKNGKLKEAGNFDTSHDYEHVIMCFAHDAPPNAEKEFLEKMKTHVYSVRHGLWKFYDEKGKLIRQTVYDKGHIKEE